jgi:hypothetical protein
LSWKVSSAKGNKSYSPSPVQDKYVVEDLDARIEWSPNLKLEKGGLHSENLTLSLKSKVRELIYPFSTISEIQGKGSSQCCHYGIHGSFWSRQDHGGFSQLSRKRIFASYSQGRQSPGKFVLTLLR